MKRREHKVSEEMQWRLEDIVTRSVLDFLVNDVEELEKENEYLRNKISAIENPDKDDMYWFEQSEKYHDKVVKLQKSNDSLIKSINALMAKVGHA